MKKVLKKFSMLLVCMIIAIVAVIGFAACGDSSDSGSTGGSSSSGSCKMEKVRVGGSQFLYYVCEKHGTVVNATGWLGNDLSNKSHELDSSCAHFIKAIKEHNTKPAAEQLIVLKTGTSIKMHKIGTWVETEEVSVYYCEKCDKVVFIDDTKCTQSKKSSDTTWSSILGSLRSAGCIVLEIQKIQSKDGGFTTSAS